MDKLISQLKRMEGQYLKAYKYKYSKSKKVFYKQNNNKCPYF